MIDQNRASSDVYANIVDLYDLEHDQFEEDIACFMNFIEAVGDPVLELGAGTGRFLIPIAEAGFRVTGLDSSEPMLAKAAARISDTDLGGLVTLDHRSMTDCDRAPGGPFGVVIAPLNGLMHLTTPTEQRSVLAAARNALDPRGQLLLDLMNPSPDALRGIDQALIHEGGWTLPDGGRVDKFSSRHIRPSEQIIRTDLWYDVVAPDGSMRRVTSQYEMRYIHRAELELMLELAGYPEWELYGSYDLDPFEDGSDRLIVAAEAS
jgi:SAM-dependent methyltransferase